MTKTNFPLKRDKYKSARGGYSRLLDVCCRKCEKTVVIYQKDGPGALWRLYLDRIFSPAEMKNLQNFNIKDVPPLKCPDCGEILGTPYIYAKEKRPAFRLFQNITIKKIKKI
ncbi:MAG: hypothetical protein WC178_01815 [Candidatus Paceibacterota bacterium]